MFLAKLYFYAILFTYLHIHLQNRIISTLGGIYIMPQIDAIVNHKAGKNTKKSRPLQGGKILISNIVVFTVGTILRPVSSGPLSEILITIL